MSLTTWHYAAKSQGFLQETEPGAALIPPSGISLQRMVANSFRSNAIVTAKLSFGAKPKSRSATE